MVATRVPWWKGAHGEWYVVGQVALIALVFFGPRTVLGWPVRALPYPQLCAAVGGGMFILGTLLLLAGLIRLGRNLTPLPYPKDHAPLIESGPYALLRHPMYGGGIAMAFGWALFVNCWLTVCYAALLFTFLDVKSRREERWLAEKFAGYAGYQRRVRKLIPFLY